MVYVAHNWNNYTTSTTTDPWGYWTSGTTSTSLDVWGSWIYEPPQKTAEQIRLEKEEYRIAQERAAIAAKEKAEKEKKKANEKAIDLLMETLDEGQKATFKKDGTIVVFGQKTKRKYQINGSGATGNIVLFDEKNNAKERWCFHLRDNMPLGDHLAAQKLMLECDEDEAIRIANKTRLDEARLAA